MPYPEIYVLRHGQTEWNREGRHQGRKDSPLTALGLEQAALQGEILRNAGLTGENVACYCSPQKRAAKTAEIALAAINATPKPDDRLMEVGFGHWEGLTLDEIDANWPGAIEAQPDMFLWSFTSVEGERFGDMAARCKSFLDSLTRPSVIVSHGITSRVLRGLWLGLDASGMNDLGGGQGCVFHLARGKQTKLEG